jgi:hypothetical protein
MLWTRLLMKFKKCLQMESMEHFSPLASKKKVIILLSYISPEISKKRKTKKSIKNKKKMK